MIYEIEKFNPYHDARGRFTNGSGAASFTIRTRNPKNQHLADRAMERERQSNTRLTPPVVAGAQRGKPMSHEEADGKRGNPGYDYDSRCCENCQSCVIAYEMRRRGYDVEAAPWEGKQNPLQKKTAQDERLAWRNEDGTPVVQFEGEFGSNVSPYKRSRVEDASYTYEMWEGDHLQRYTTRETENLTAKRAAKEIDSCIGEGRYTISYIPKGQRSSGHIVVAERVNGEVRIFDPQNGRSYNLEEFSKSGKWQISRTNTRRYGDKMTWNAHPLVQRIDNKILKDDYANAVLKAKPKENRQEQQRLDREWEAMHRKVMEAKMVDFGDEW